MRPEFGIHVMIQESPEKELSKEEVSFLLEKIGCLQQLIAELLLKNQQLREALTSVRQLAVGSGGGVG